MKNDHGKLKLIFAFASSLAMTAGAANWDGEISTDWNDGTNWDGNIVPNGSNAIINATPPNICTIFTNISATPVDIIVGRGVSSNGRVDHLAGNASTGPGNWVFVGDEGGSGVYNLADTTTFGGGFTGYGPGSGNLFDTGNLLLGIGSGSAGTFNMNSSGILTVGLYFVIGGNNGTGTFNLDGGAVTVGNNAEIPQAITTNSLGTMNISGGSMSADLFTIGPGLNAASTQRGYLNLTGGSASSRRWFTLGFAGNTNTLGSVTNSGGTINVNTVGAGSLELSVFDATRSLFVQNSGQVNLLNNANIQYGAGGNHTGVCTFNHEGGTVTFYSDGGTNMGGTGALNLGTVGSTGTYTYNLDGGTLRVTKVQKPGAASGTFNFNGGTLVATTNKPLAGDSLMGGLTAAFVKSGGVNVDSAGHHVNIPQVLLVDTNSPGGGLVKHGAGILNLSGGGGGSTYTGPTIVSNGILRVDGKIAVSPVTVRTNAAVGGAGNISSSVSLDSGNAGVNLTNGVAQTLTVNAITLQNGNLLSFDVGTTADLITNTGLFSFAASGVSTIRIKPISGITNGSYTLLTGVDFADTYTGNFTFEPVAGYSFALDAYGFNIDVIVTVTGAASWAWATSPGTPNFSGINWTTGTVPGAAVGTPSLAGDSIYFGPSSQLSPNVDKLYDVAGLTFITNAGSFTFGTTTNTLSFSGFGGIVVNNSTNAQTFNVPLVLGGDQTFNTASGDMNANSGVSGGAGLTKSGPGKLTLSGTNTYAGATAVRNGTLEIRNAKSGLGQILAGTTTGETATVNILATGKTVAASTGLPGFGLATGGSSTGTVNMSGGQLTSGGQELWIGGGDDSIGTFNLNGGEVVVSTWGVVGRDGYGTLNITGGGWTNSGANNFVMASFSGATGIVNITGGRLVKTHNAAANQGQIWVGEGGVGIMNINGGEVRAERNASPALVVGRTTGSGSIRLNSGTLFSDDQIYLGHGTGAGPSYAAMTVNGGSLTTDWFFVIGLNNDRAVYNQSGGSFVENNGWPTIAAGGVNSLAVATLSGGTFTATNAANGGFFAGENGSGVLNVSGSALITVANQGLSAGVVAGSTGTVNLAGGVVNANIVKKGAGTGRLNFHGGTLKATGSSTNYMTGLNNAYIHGGGANIDDGGFAITVGQALTSPTGSGVSSIPLTAGGAGYIDTPLVQITGGGGVGATAIAQINYASGVITNILITNPGVDYSSEPTVTLLGGAGTGAAATGTVTLAANTSGGLTKQGAGTLTLSAASTYAGKTLVQNGTLALASGGTIASTSITVNAGAIFAPGTDFTNTGVQLTIEITGASTHGRVAAGGTATLTGGDLVVVTNGYAPVPGNSFTVLTALAVSGTFATTNLPPLTGGANWAVTYNPDSVVLSVSAGVPDADGDGIPDAWETIYCGGPTNCDAGAQTGDGDTYTFLQEYILDSNPTVSNVFMLTAVTSSPPVTLRFASTNSRVYTVEYNAQLTNGAGWTALGAAQSGSNGSHTVTDPANATNRNYRIKVQVP